MESLYLIGGVQSLFAMLLFRKKPQNTLADRFLIVWILIVGVEMLYSLINSTIYTDLHDLIVIPFCYGPFLLCYTRLLLENLNSIPKSLHVQLIPAYLFAIISLLWPGEMEIDTLDVFEKGSITVISTINFSCFLASMTFYIHKVWRLITKHNRHYDENYSHQSIETRIHWVGLVGLWIFIGFFITSITYLVFIGLNIYPFKPILIYHFSLVIFLFSITYYGIHQIGVPRIQHATSESDNDVSKEQSQAILNKLTLCMRESRPFLERELSIQDLAYHSKLTTQEISHALNHHLQINFFTYINEYRVAEARKLLKDEKSAELTILAIGYDSGFNSKSSFNSIFKKYTGQTPSEFRKNRKI